MVGKVKCAARKWFQKQNTNFLRTDFKNQCSVGGSVLQCVVILQENNFAALKIIYLDTFIFISLKYISPFIFYFSGGKTYQPALVLFWDFTLDCTASSH